MSSTAQLFPCRECGRWFPLRKDGRIPLHKPVKGARRTFAQKWCYGASTKPKCRDPNGLRVLRDATRLLHFDEDGIPVCGYDGEVIAAIHPLDRAAMWCSACMQTLAARSPRKAVDLRG